MIAIHGIRAKKIDDLVQRACDYYGVKKEDLCMSRKGTQLFRWKKYLVVVLYDHTDLSFTEIQSVLGYKSYNAMHYNYEVLKEQLSEDRFGDDKIKLSYNELLKHLGL
jgi:chromosomal replication initiation ATPase DnaA